MERFARFGILCSLLWALLACQKTAVKPDPEPFVTGSGELSQQYIEDLLLQANSAPPEERIRLQLTAMEALIRAGVYDWARSLAEEFPEDLVQSLPAYSTERGRWAFVQAQLAAIAGDTTTALTLLAEESLLDNLQFYPEELVLGIRQLRAQLFFDLGDYPAAVDERIILTPALASDEDAALINQELLWQTLMEMPLPQLLQHAESAPDRAHQGWYSLAVISKDNQNDMRKQLTQLDEWQRQWPEHPASLAPPADLQLLRELVANQAKHIAVLLPESGRLKAAADAIKTGILAAYFNYKNTQPDPPSLTFYDTETGDINAIYNTALSNGAELIIGPLAKDKIIILSGQLNLPVPTLALNTVDNPLGYIGNLYQFGLAIEDEALQAADKIWRDGHRQVLIIAPNNLWGDRSAMAFSQQWQSLGGEGVHDYRFEDKNDYAKVIKHAFQVDESEVRARRIRSLVGNIEFEPRRRQDIDAIFVAATAEQARQIKPTLAFYFASNVPVYATSQVYDGISNTKLDQDMNGIVFSTLPWYFNPKLPEHKVIAESASANSKLHSLYALGVDSFYVYPRLKQLKTVAGSRFYGQTGALEMDQSGQIRRKQVWAEFANGKAKKLNTTD